MGIVMSDQEIHAEIGKARENYRNAKKELQVLENRAAGLAGAARQLLAALENPQRMEFSIGTPIMGNWIVISESLFTGLNADNIRKLSEDIRRVIKTKEALRQQLI